MNNLITEEFSYTFDEWVNEWVMNNCDFWKEHSFEYVYKKTETGRILLYEQCQKCGVRGTLGLVKHEKVPNLKYKIQTNQIKKYSEELEKSGPTYDRYLKEYWHPRNEYLKSKKVDDWRKEHNEYLQTPQWRAIRQKVFKRDNFLCQGCLENQATQVHHKTYDHWKKEFMYELISLCRSCHERQHNINQ